ncbi:MAG: Aspartate aminotransferase [Chlamydiales bacterium]|nr:Aspartate aminotransferase [Chlamydiales bacterium]MCH9635089.1 Aspartate aminotransferase [Chlamydiales bacterium]
MEFFESLETLPPDSLFGVQRAFEIERSEHKVNLSIGTYKTEELKPYILPSVKQAERELFEKEHSKDYLPILGLADYIKSTAQLVFASNLDDLIGAQTVGGTGALRLAAELLVRAGHTKLYIGNPTWGNHHHIFSSGGMEIESFDHFAGPMPFESMSPNSVVLLQPCCHNPTGCDYTKEQWEAIAEIVKRKNLLPLFDMAYQGFGLGVEEDAYAVRYFAESSHPFMLAISHSKIFGLYRERTGALFVRHSGVKRLESQLRRLVRGIYSNPPSHGASIVAHILSHPDLKDQWLIELAAMRQRIVWMRAQLAAQLPGFEFLLDQRGMFSYTRLSREQVLRLRSEYGIYMTEDGRINVAGLNSKNVGYVSKAILSLK